ncbi:ABC transporter permease subunit [uncultured Aquimarina sp.]|uniref:ABC transporter permease n=1 Tax=uncultured Aquimarina sp. TaxID=575652 RepID=UPI002624D2FD|nr:ABC transporter permease subunit [uncultured Aquimarina sp.]
MLRLLNIEFQKLRFNKSAKVLTITYFVLITAIALIASYEFNFGGVKVRLADQGIFNFPYIWHFTSYIAAWLKIFLAIVIVSIMANEYTNRTLKQNLIDGLSKKEFLTSKFLTVIVFSLISTIFLFTVALVLGLIFSDYNEFSIIITDLDFILAYFIKLVGFFSFCMFLGILIKRSAFALGFLIFWQIIEGIVWGLASLVKWKFDSDLVYKIIPFLPLDSMANLINEPWSRLNFIQAAANQLGEGFQRDYAVHWYEILIVLVWTAIFVRLSYYLLKKRDL